MTTQPPAPLDEAASALYAAALHLETAAKNARTEADTLTTAAAAARVAYENATIHTGEPRCGITQTDRLGGTVGPCARPAKHPEAYHRNAAGTQLWLQKRPATA